MRFFYMNKKKSKRQRVHNKLKKEVKRKKQMNESRVKKDLHSSGETDKEEQLLLDSSPLFQGLGESQSPLTLFNSSPETMREILSAVIDSYDLVDEPEFEDISIAFETIEDTLQEVVQDLGLDDEETEDLDDEGKIDLHEQLITESTKRLLTEELLEKIKEAVRSLRLRYKASGHATNVPKTSLIQLILEKKEFPELIPLIGLIQGVILKNFWAPCAIMNSFQEVQKRFNFDLDKLEQAIINGKIDFNEIGQEMINIPGMKRYVQEQNEEAFRQGILSLYNYEINLRIFTDEELSEARSIIIETLRESDSEEADKEGDSDQTIDQIIIDQIRDFVNRFMIQERIEDVLVKICAKIKEEDTESSMLPFLLYIKAILEKDPLGEKTLLILTSALVGEIQTQEE